jgi:hypothetical protein
MFYGPFTFLWTITCLFSYGYAIHKSTKGKNGPALRAISKAMRIRRYNAECISQYGRSRATLDATGCFHWASNCHVLPIAPADDMVIDFGIKN